MSATPSHNNTSALDLIVSNLSGVVGNLENPAMQGQAVAAGFWEDKNTGYTENDVAFVRGLCHVFEPRYMSELWKEWGKKIFSDEYKSPDEEDEDVCHKDGCQDISIHLY